MTNKQLCIVALNNRDFVERVHVVLLNKSINPQFEKLIINVQQRCIG